MNGALKAPAAGSIHRPTMGPALAAAVVHLLYRPGPRLAAAAALPPQIVGRSNGFLHRHRASQRALLHGMAAVETITIIAGAAPLAVAQAVEAPAVLDHTPFLWVAVATQAAFPMAELVALLQGTGTHRGVACAGTEPFGTHLRTMQALAGAREGVGQQFSGRLLHHHFQNSQRRKHQV